LLCYRIPNPFGHSPVSQLAADNNDAEAQFNLALCLTEGKGVGPALMASVRYLKLAADRNHAGAQYNYGVCLEKGEGVGVDLIASAKYLKLAADQDYAKAQFHYGLCLAEGKGVNVDLVQSANYLKHAADQGLPVAVFYYGLCLANGSGVQIDFLGSGRYFKYAADHGRPSPRHGNVCPTESGLHYPISRTMARVIYDQTAVYGEAARLTALGECLEFGKHAEKDLVLAAECYATASTLGHSRAYVNFGFCLEHGLGVEPDLCESVSWYEDSVRRGDAAGSFYYGLCLHFGTVFSEDPEDASDHYEISAQRNSTHLRTHASRCLRALSKRRVVRPDCARPSVTRGNGRVTPRYMPFPTLLASSSQFRVSPIGEVRGRLLGQGGFGVVTLERDPKTEKCKAVKRISMPDNWSSLSHEVETLTKLRHPCLVHFLGWAGDPTSKEGEIHLGYAPNGPVSRVLGTCRNAGHRPAFWTPTRIGIVICDVVLGMRYIHSRGIMHRDLKPSNILLSRNYRGLVSDFGLSTFESRGGPWTGDTGTVRYAAPEQGYDGPHTKKLDVFSFGLILYEIIGNLPVFGAQDSDLDVARRLQSRDLPNIPGEFGRLMQELIPRCWSWEPESRPSFDEIFRKFESAGFAILPNADASVIRNAVSQVLAWERNPERSLPDF
jgi:TPR repeat protein